ncbi:MAG: hypothetical protein ACE5FU_07550 [Nitrospinota bacterium]
MKEIRMERWNLEEANTRIGKNFDEKYWRFLVTQIVQYPEISFSSTKGIESPSYIPLKEVILEILGEIDGGSIDVESCEVCKEYFDINKEDGIFGDPSALKNFICQSCSLKLSAKEFFDTFLVLKSNGG